jgi:hypothetical protein
MSADPAINEGRFTRFLAELHPSVDVFLAGLRIHINCVTSLDELRMRLHALQQQVGLPFTLEQWMPVLQHHAAESLMPELFDTSSLGGIEDNEAVKCFVDLLDKSDLTFFDLAVEAFNSHYKKVPPDAIRQTWVADVTVLLTNLRDRKQEARRASMELVRGAVTVDALEVQLGEVAAGIRRSPSKGDKGRVLAHTCAAITACQVDRMEDLFAELAQIVSLTTRQCYGQQLIDARRISPTKQTRTRAKITDALMARLRACFHSNHLTTDDYNRQSALQLIALMKIKKNEPLLPMVKQVLTDGDEFARLRGVDPVWEAINAAYIGSVTRLATRIDELRAVIADIEFAVGALVERKALLFRHFESVLACCDIESIKAGWGRLVDIYRLSVIRQAGSAVIDRHQVATEGCTHTRTRINDLFKMRMMQYFMMNGFSNRGFSVPAVSDFLGVAEAQSCSWLFKVGYSLLVKQPEFEKLRGTITAWRPMQVRVEILSQVSSPVAAVAGDVEVLAR